MAVRGARAARGEPVIGFLSARSAKESEHLVDAFRKGMAEQGIVEGQNTAISPLLRPSGRQGRQFERARTLRVAKDSTNFDLVDDSDKTTAVV